MQSMINKIKQAIMLSITRCVRNMTTQINRTFKIILTTALFLVCSNVFATTSTEIKTIMVTSVVDHPSLQQAKQGIIDELREQGYVIGKNLKLIEENGNGTVSMSSTIAKKFVSKSPDVIVPISTPSAQTVIKASVGTKIPIVFCSVTDPVAAGIVKNYTDLNPRITGAIDFPPLQEELAMIKALFPKAQTIGVLYSPSEANSVKVVGMLKQIASDAGLRVFESVVMSSNLILESLESLINKVDVIYVPSDNTVFSAMPKLAYAARHNKVPLFTSDPDSVKQGALGCYGYVQYSVGRAAGRLIAKYLDNDTTVLEKGLQIMMPSTADIFINQKTANELGIVVPEVIGNTKVNTIQ